MNGVWIDWLRVNGGPLVETGGAAHLQLEPIVSKVILLGQPPSKPTGYRMLLQGTGLAAPPADGLFECWGPNNPNGITDPVYPWGYVALVRVTWEAAALPDSGAPVAGAYVGTQLAVDVMQEKVLAASEGRRFYNGYALMPALVSPAEQAAAAQADEDPPAAHPPVGV